MVSAYDMLFSQPAQQRISEMYLEWVNGVSVSPPGCQLKGPEVSPVPRQHIKAIIAYFTWIKNASPMMSTYAVLIAIYTSVYLRKFVMEHTRADRCQAYFTGFCSRMERYLCGNAGLRIQCKSPPEIVVAEWLYFTKITHRYR